MKVGIVGATNVGKSTLFNALIGSHRAIVTSVHGTTRDVLSHRVDWDEGSVVFLDSPGLNTFDEEIPYLRTVIDDSDIILFVIDHSVGFGAKEQEIYRLLLESGKKSQCCLVVNKLESVFQKDQGVLMVLGEYYSLGFSIVLGISAKSRLGISQLKEFVLGHIESVAPDDDTDLVEDDKIPLAFVGKPNAGKSTLMNTLLGENKVLVSEIAGTTLDYNVCDITYDYQDYRLYDTAGIRKKGKIHGLEKIAYDKTLSMLRYIRPMVVFLVDGDVGMTHRDTTLLGEILNLCLPVVVCVNKVDLLNKSILKEKIKQTQVFLQFAKFIPVLGISGKDNLGLEHLFGAVQKIWLEYTKSVPTPDLNRVVKKGYLTRPPRFPKNKECKISYITQIDIKCPTFMVFVNNKQRANFSFKKWLENTLRFSYGFVGVPLRFLWRNKGDKSGD